MDLQALPGRTVRASTVQFSPGIPVEPYISLLNYPCHRGYTTLPTNIIEALSAKPRISLSNGEFDESRCYLFFIMKQVTK